MLSNVGVVKSYLGDISGKGDRVRVFSDFCLATAIATVLGSLAGGWLCRPAIQYCFSFIFKLLILIRFPQIVSSSGFLALFPYFIPNLLCALLCLLAFMLTWRYIDEKKKPEYVKLETVVNAETASFPDSKDMEKDSDPPIPQEEQKNGHYKEFQAIMRVYRTPLILCFLYSFAALISFCFRNLLPV